MIKKNIALVTGGYSAEQSPKSAAVVEKFLNPSLYNVYTILIGKNSWTYNGIEVDKADFSISIDGLKILFDAVFNCIHGSPGEDGKLQGYFDMLDIPYVGCGNISMSLTFNKSYCNKVVASLGVVNVANSIHLFKNRDFDTVSILDRLQLPVIVKPAEQGASIGVYKVTTKKELEPAIENAFQVDDQILIEEFIKGRELTCGVYQINGTTIALPITEVISSKGFFDYEAKITPSMSNKITPAQTPEDITQAVHKASVAIYEQLNCKGVVRIDFIYEETTGKVFFLEVNTIPGMRYDSILPTQIRISGGNLTDFYTSLLEDIMKEKCEDQRKGNELLGQFDTIQEKTASLYEKVIETPCKISKSISELFGLELYLKKEYQQVTGSFNARGALFALQNLSNAEKQNGVVTASLGNHGIALAYHGMRLGIPVTVVISKYAATPAETYGAHIIVHGEQLKQAKNYAQVLAKEQGKRYIDANDDPFVVFGQGTVGVEILEQVLDVEAILVPIGGGDLIAGVTLAVKTLNPKVQIIGVRPNETPARSGGTFDIPDGLVTRFPEGSAFKLVQNAIDRIVAVDENEIAKAILTLSELENISVEGFAALGIAALASEELEFLKGKRVVAILSGGNIDVKTISQAIDRALFVKGRLTRLQIIISSQGIKSLLMTIVDLGASIRDVSIKPIGVSSRNGTIEADIVLEFNTRVDFQEFRSQMSLKYKKFSLEAYSDPGLK